MEYQGLTSHVIKFLLPLLQYADRNSGSLNQDEAVLGRCHYQAPRADAIHPSDTGFPDLCLKFCKSMTDLVKSCRLSAEVV